MFFIPTIINDLTKVDVGNTVILTDVPEPSIGASGIRIDTSIINTTANQPEVRTVVILNDSKDIAITAFEPSLLLALFFPATEVSLTANEPEGVGSFVSVGQTSITVTAFAPQRPRIALEAEFIIFYNDNRILFFPTFDFV